MSKTSIHEELRVLEEANYQSLDEKRITITAWLVNKVAELQEEQFNESRNLRAKIDEIWIEMKHIQEQIDNLISEPLCWRTDCKNPEAIIAPHIHTEQDQEKLEDEKMDNLRYKEAVKALEDRCPRCASHMIRKRDTHWYCQHCAHMWSI